MDSPRLRWSWKEGFLFALAWTFRFKDEGLTHPMYKIEGWGTWYLHPLYKMLHWAFLHIRKPFVIILVTFIALIAVAIAFYDIPALIVLEKIFPPKLIRFIFFLYVETVLLSMGWVSFSRFQNLELMRLWKSGRLAPIFPGDREYTDLR